MSRNKKFGSGWLSGTLSATLGIMGLGGVLCLLFPAQLTMPELREVYPVPIMRGLIHVVLVGAFVLGAISVVLSPSKALGATGLVSTLIAVLLGGSEVPIEGPIAKSEYLGLDWFLLNLLLLALIFVPMERLFGRLKDQEIFRPAWETDLLHFMISHLLVQVSVLLTMAPARAVFSLLPEAVRNVQAAVGAQWYIVQFLEVVLVADLSEYWVHRAFHRVPLLWRFHAIHHSCRRLDWLAASRLHLVDIVVTRGLTFVPLFVLGFADGPVFAYLVFVSFHAIFIHANVRFRFARLGEFLVTPRFHHWHHSDQPEAIDKNFAVHIPAIDRVFGTHYLPSEWPSSYGISGDPVPESYVSQVVYPFLPGR